MLNWLKSVKGMKGFFKFGKLQVGSLALVGRSYHSKKIQEVARESEV